MSDFSDKLIADLQAKAKDAFSQFGAIVADDLRKNLSVPVGYRLGPEGGSTPIRSAPGEDPRTEEGDYVGSIDNTTEILTDVVRTEIFTDMQRGQWLEEGTSRMAARPHFKPVFDEFSPGAVSFIGDRMFK